MKVEHFNVAIARQNHEAATVKWADFLEGIRNMRSPKYRMWVRNDMQVEAVEEI